MITLKFGGTSMGSAERIKASAAIIMGRHKDGERLSVVVSAVAGVSNSLEALINAAKNGDPVDGVLGALESLHYDISNELAGERGVPLYSNERVKARLTPYFLELRKLLNAVESFGECPLSIHCRIMGMGELLSSAIMEEVLFALGQANGFKSLWLDSRLFIYTTGDEDEGVADYTRCMVAFQSYRDGVSHDDKGILLFPGFISTWRREDHTDCAGLLGRNGSDYSAAIVAWGLNSKRVEFWTDVDGVYTADPKVVKDAIIIKNMSYNEAMELSFFGSKVLHPRTLAPLVEKGIEAWSLNSKNIDSHGTRISSGDYTSERNCVLCGVSALKGVALITVSGSALRGTRGAASRIFSTVGAAGASMLLITQGSSEYTISFCVKAKIAGAVMNALSREFLLEIKSGVLNEPSLVDNCAIVSIVGDGMVRQKGVAATFMHSLTSAAINIYAIAQGSSERNISCVIDNSRADDAVRATHYRFFMKKKRVSVFCFGAGTIGGEFLRQVSITNSKKLDIKIIAITTIDGMILKADGLDLNNWQKAIKKEVADKDVEWRPFGGDNVDTVIDFVKEKHPENPVFVDCTASDLPKRYEELLKLGISVITPNKRGNTATMKEYRALREAAAEGRAQFLYETNVGAGLPIIEPLQKLLIAGDRVRRFDAIPSGSLSYIFGKLDEGEAFSKAVLDARARRYTEPDPREDLAGRDAARKALIIARECGVEAEMSDIALKDCFSYAVENGGPKLDLTGEWGDFEGRLKDLDAWFTSRVRFLQSEGKRLRMGVRIEFSDNNKATIEAGVMEVEKDSPLYNVREGNNVFVFYSDYYSPEPLVIMGYGAGAKCTAAGVLSDLLRAME